MNRRALILKSHVRHEVFIRDLKPILSLWSAASVGLYVGRGAILSEGNEEQWRLGWQLILEAVEIAKEMMDQLCALLHKWPNAVWLFFPDLGWEGWSRTLKEFYLDTYPVLFPGKISLPPNLPKRRVKKFLLCGTTKRMRRETMRAFDIWDQFKTGKKPVELASMVSQQVRSSRSFDKHLKSNLMAVLRSLQRAHLLIYAMPLATDRGQRRLTDFDSALHMSNCQQCRNAKTVEQMCKRAQDFANQDYSYEREQLVTGSDLT